MNPKTQALIDRIASGTTTEADAEKVKAFIQAYDDWAKDINFDAWGNLDVIATREALK